MTNAANATGTDLTPAQAAREAKRAKSIRTSIIGISIALAICIVLALISMFVSGEAQTGVMFASYGAGYIAFIWALYTGYQHYRGPSAKK